MRRGLMVLATLQTWAERRPYAARALVFVVAALSIALRTGDVVSPAAKPVPQDARLALIVLASLGGTGGAPRLGGDVRVMPGYALVLATLASVDPATHDSLVCTTSATRCSKVQLHWLYVLQAILALATLYLFYAASLILSGSRDVAFLTALLLLLGSPFGEPAGYPYPYVYPAFLLAAFAALGSAAARRHSLALFAASGAVLGLAGLFTVILVPALAVAAIAVLAVPAASGPRRTARAAAVAAGGVSVAAAAYALLHGIYDPAWALRSLTYDLSLRAGYDIVTPGLAAFGTLLQLPLVGAAAEALAPTSWAKPFGPYVDGSYLMRGHTQVYPAVLAAGQTAGGELFHLFNRIGAEVTGYLLATPVVLVRGLLAKADVVAVLGLLNWRTMFAYHGAVGDGRLLLLVLSPFLTLLVAGTLFTTNMLFAPVAIGFVHAYAIAYVSGRL